MMRSEPGSGNHVQLAPYVVKPAFVAGGMEVLMVLAWAA